ncbi:MAG: PadR family transcriptional regulator [Stackebrandtia sp.]
MLELAILGFVADGPLHGYQLRRRISRLSGHTRPVSDGSLYPAIDRLVTAGLLDRRTEPGSTAVTRRMLRLTRAGRERLHERLRNPSELDITDGTRFFTVLAFLSLLPEPEERAAVLARRLDFLDQPAGFFYDGDRPLPAKELADPYRRGMLTVAAATRRAEIAWLREMLDST